MPNASSPLMHAMQKVKCPFLPHKIFINFVMASMEWTNIQFSRMHTEENMAR